MLSTEGQMYERFVYKNQDYLHSNSSNTLISKILLRRSIQ